MVTCVVLGVEGVASIEADRARVFLDLYAVDVAGVVGGGAVDSQGDAVPGVGFNCSRIVAADADPGGAVDEPVAIVAAAQDICVTAESRIVETHPATHFRKEDVQDNGIVVDVAAAAVGFESVVDPEGYPVGEVSHGDVFAVDDGCFIGDLCSHAINRHDTEVQLSASRGKIAVKFPVPIFPPGVVTDVTKSIFIFIFLAGILVAGTVVIVINDAISVAVSLTGIPDSIFVGIFLAFIGDSCTIVVRIGNAVFVGVNRGRGSGSF